MSLGKVKSLLSSQKIILMILALGLVLSNFSITVLIANELSFGSTLDVYYVALAVYLFFLTLIGWSLTNVITPYLIKNNTEENFSKVLSVVLVWGGGVFVVLFFLSPLLSRLIFYNFADVGSSLYFNLIFIFAIFLFLVDLIAQVFICLEYSANRYVRAASINLISSLVGLILSLVLVQWLGIIGALLVQVSMKFVLLSLLFYLNKKAVHCFQYERSIAKAIYSKAKYFLFSGIFYRSEDLVEKMIASYLAPGLLSLLSFVQRVYGAVITVINSALVAPTLTKFCNNLQLCSQAESHKLIKSISMLILMAGVIGFPIVCYVGEPIFLLVFSENIVSVQDYLLLTLLFIFPTLMFFTESQLLHNFLLSRELEKKIVLNDTFAFVMALIVKIYSTLTFGYVGLLMSVSFGAFLKMFLKIILVLRVIRCEKQAC